eukprot:3041623-Rhodomonas_salina.2
MKFVVPITAEQKSHTLTVGTVMAKASPYSISCAGNGADRSEYGLGLRCASNLRRRVRAEEQIRLRADGRQGNPGALGAQAYWIPAFETREHVQPDSH